MVYIQDSCGPEKSWELSWSNLHRQPSREAGGGAEGQLPPLADKGGKWYQMPPFRRLNGMMAASTGKNIGIYR